ncbi:MAG: ABC-2 family transporter protein [Devosia sp.]
MLGTIGLLMKMFVKTQMEHHAGFWLDRVAQIINYGAAYAAIWVLLLRFGTLGGWNWNELALLLSFQLLTYSIGASLSFVQLRDLDQMVRLGTFDVLLVKPISPWVYLVFGGFNAVGYSGHIALAIGLMVWSLAQVSVEWNAWSVIYLTLAVISSSMVTAAVITMIGAVALVTVQSNHLFSIYFGFWELTRYPVNIFPAAIQWIMVTVMPLAFMAYVPVAVFLGKQVAVLGEWGMVLSLLAGPILVGLAMMQWRWSIRHYQGAGG